MPVKSRNTAMSGSPEPNPQQEADALEVATEQVIAACDGDLRAAVQALIVANSLLEAELNDVHAAAAKGLPAGRGSRGANRTMRHSRHAAGFARDHLRAHFGQRTLGVRIADESTRAA
jgi:hypothetical protein